MNDLISPTYAPALRMKSGELTGLQCLSPDVAERLLPRLIVPPPKERDRKLQQQLFQLPEQPRVHGMLANYWVGRPVVLQCGYLMKEVAAEPLMWLPNLFSNAREHGIDAIPAFSLHEIASFSEATRRSLDRRADLQLGLVIHSAQMADPNLPSQISAALNSLGVAPERSVVFADFSDADLSEPEIVAPIIHASMERLQEIGSWKYVAFQGTSFPEHNPASHNQTERVERNEWLAWAAAVHYQQDTPDGLLFGDFAADCAKMSFGKGQGRAIRHLRYATRDCWYIVRAAEMGRDAVRMRDVCKRITNSSWYDGRQYSVADDHIFRIANNLSGPGTAADWRAINTCHHVSRVVHDLGATKGLRFSSLDEAKLESPQEAIPYLLGGHTAE